MFLFTRITHDVRMKGSVVIVFLVFAFYVCHAQDELCDAQYWRTRCGRSYDLSQWQRLENTLRTKTCDCWFWYCDVDYEGEWWILHRGFEGHLERYCGNNI